MKENFLEDIVQVVKECADIMLEARDIDRTVITKEGHANFVTAYDKRVQQELFSRLGKLFPEAKFLGEEDEERQNCKWEEGMLFIIDPIDGTSNFMKAIDHSCISVGVAIDGKRYAGVIYDPYKDECFTAERGKGAYRNGKAIHVSDTDLAHSLVIYGTSPYYDDLCDRSFLMAREYCREAMDVRRSGSAALDLCDVACGRYGMFFELKLQPWDFSAGIVIVEEAGGSVLTEEGTKLPLVEASSIFARNGVIDDSMIKQSMKERYGL